MHTVRLFWLGSGSGLLLALFLVSCATVSRPAAELPILADQTARRHGIDPRLFRALIEVESLWNPNAVSSKGASGLTQLMPATALGECALPQSDIFDPAKNLDCGAYYFAKQLRRFRSARLALAAYNAGPERVAQLGRVPYIPETQRYVNRIMALWARSGKAAG